MNNNETKPGGDKVIARLRDTGEVAENLSKNLLGAAAIAAAVTFVIRVVTDIKVGYNDYKRRKEGRV